MSRSNARDRGIPVTERRIAATDNPFAFPEGTAYEGWTTQPDGSLERGGGPILMRVEPNTRKAGSGYVWRLLVHSWVEPITIEVDSGTERNLYVAKAQAFWSAYARIHIWLRSLIDDGTLI